MKYYLLVLAFQILFNIFKVLEIKYTYENRLNLMINTIFEKDHGYKIPFDLQ